MIQFNVNYNLDAIEQQVQRAATRAQAILDEQILKDSNYYVPMDTNTLERSGITNSKIGEGVLIWNTPYARRIYYGVEFNFSKDKNPHARALWFEYAKSVHLQSWKDLAKRAIEDNL